MRLHNIFFILIGIFLMGLGALGVVLPVLPTTPFLILASACFVRGSDRFDAWFRNTKIYKNYAEDFIRERSMTRQRKIKIMVLSDAMLSIPFFTTDYGILKLFIASLVVCKHYYFIFKIKTKEVEE